MICSSVFRHQRLYSLLDRFRLMVAPDTTSPTPVVTSHPLDGEGQPALETVVLDKVRLCLEISLLKESFAPCKIFGQWFFLCYSIFFLSITVVFDCTTVVISRYNSGYFLDTLISFTILVYLCYMLDFLLPYLMSRLHGNRQLAKNIYLSVLQWAIHLLPILLFLMFLLLLVL